MEIKKKDIKKIKHATKEELVKLHEEYKAVSKNVSGMSPAGLMLIAVAGVVVMFLFQNKFFVLIGLIMLLYPIYIFIRRGAHREGYFDGYYEMMTKLGARENESTNSEKSDQE
ncbi:MAG: hypothetical protein AAB479_01130 [Patescibacteria group bacterium]